MTGCAVSIDLRNYEAQVDAEDAAEDFRAQWIEDNRADMVALLLANTDFRTETLGDYYREADVAYMHALQGDAISCANILANLLRKAAAEEADRLLYQFARQTLGANVSKLPYIPTAHNVKTRWD